MIAVSAKLSYKKLNLKMSPAKSRPFCLGINVLLTQWGRVTHVCVSKLTIIGSDNDLSPERHQAIIWISAGILLIEQTSVESQSEFYYFHYTKCIENVVCGHFVIMLTWEHRKSQRTWYIWCLMTHFNIPSTVLPGQVHLKPIREYTLRHKQFVIKWLYHTIHHSTKSRYF